MSTFEPIAVVGQACVLPNALNPEALWELVLSGQSAVGPVPRDRWGVDPSAIACRPEDDSTDKTWSDAGGYVRGFDQIFDPSGFNGLSAQEVLGLDPLFQWTLHTVREALRDAGAAGNDRTGLVMGNLSFPAAKHTELAQFEWLSAQPQLLAGQGAQLAGIERPDPRNHFHSGLPAHLAAHALGLGSAFALDAACASSLYAVKLACDKLQDREADTMVAGAVNCADDLFIHVGFCALSAMSKTGQSRPFHSGADGLVPGEGAAFLVLKRLSDAVAAGDTIHGVIRGVGLSNDGRARNLLAPAEAGQQRAMQLAYDVSGVSPSEVGLVECHATGTPVGDTTELNSTGAVYAGLSDVPIGSLKSNLGHLITAAGAAGMIKVMAAMKHGVRPPTLHIDSPLPAVAGSPFRLLERPEPWTQQGPKRAGVSAFGFGGNNAHVVLEEYVPETATTAFAAPSGPLAVVALGSRVGAGASAKDFVDTVVAGKATPTSATEVGLNIKGLRFPPNDLADALPQQIQILAAAREALPQLGAALPNARTGVYVGMSCDAEIARYGARWRAEGWADSWARAGVVLDGEQRQSLRDAFIHGLQSSGVLGTMPNIPANRLNSQFDAGGPSFTVSAEELSGVRALEIGARALRAHEIDAAIIGAVDMSDEPVHRAALAALDGDRPAADAAIVLVLKRQADAERDGDHVLALISDEASAAPLLHLSAGQSPLSPMLGHAHAASGLVHVAAAVLSTRTGQASSGIDVVVDALYGQRGIVRVRPASTAGQPLPAFLTEDPMSEPNLTWPAHAAPVVLPEAHLMATGPRSLTAETANPVVGGLQQMPSAPTLPAVMGAAPVVAHTARPAAPVYTAPPTAAARPVVAAALQAPAVAPVAPMAAGTDPMAAVGDFHRRMGEAHRNFLTKQAEVHKRFLEMRQNALFGLAQAAGSMPAQAAPVAAHVPALPPVAAPVASALPIPPPVVPVTSMLPSEAAPPVPDRMPAAPTLAKPVVRPSPKVAAIARPAVRVAPTPAPKPSAKPAAKPSAKPTAKPAIDLRGVVPYVETPKAENLPGPKLDKDGLRVHSSGTISEIFGPMFEQQDQYAVQVRMPEPPLLLADRLLGIDAEPGVHGTGTLWTQTDVHEDSWWLHQGHMPAGIMIESGQADLMLISWMGTDFKNKGERAYRLLGCELTYHAAPDDNPAEYSYVLPKPGETLTYDIHVDGHANQGDIRMFFFHYDCRINGHPRLTVRSGQAGFFSEEELENSAGVLWTPEEGEVKPLNEVQLDKPSVANVRSSLSKEELIAFSEGRVADCFGEGFHRMNPHTESPRIADGRLLFLDRVTDIQTDGGPWKRGYLRAEQDIEQDTWFFDGHFKNDPCMPGTLMFDGCLQAMAVYMSALGYTIEKDGWRFEPIPNEPYQMRCRGQVLPHNRNLVYEIFVEEVIEGPVPMVYADLLCTIDGRKAFHCRRMGLRCTPGYPLDRMKLEAGPGADKPTAVVDGFTFDYRSLIACATGRPSEAFGPMYQPFDGTRTCARLPGEPYHFMHRIAEVEGPIGGMKKGTRVVAEYEVPADVWYVDENSNPTMPYAVLMEAALQPCGWLASYIGCATTTDKDILFRNLDGTATMHRAVPPGGGTLRTESTLTSLSQQGGMIITGFEVKCWLDGDPLYDLTTVFGFFPPEAFVNQAGLPVPKGEKGCLDEANDFLVDLVPRPERYCEGTARLANPMLLMIDRVDGYWPEGGEHGKGRFRAQKDVRSKEWFFKSHFYSDPVQPGSLGIEALHQLLQFAMLELGLDEGLEAPEFESVLYGVEHAWKYRGQVVPDNKVISSVIDIVETGEDEDGRFAIADGSLWVDGKRIYQIKKMGMRLRPTPRPRLPQGETGERSSNSEGDTAAVERLDPAVDGWLNDHCPTWTVPALPMMSMLDLMAGAAARETGRTVVGLNDVQVWRWLDLPHARDIRVDVTGDGDKRRCVLHAERDGTWEMVAEGKVMLGSGYPSGRPAALAPMAGETMADPYATGTLFHGPDFHLLDSLIMNGEGSSAVLTATPNGVPVGTLNQGLLDAATHAIPHDQLWRWSPEIDEDMVAYPARVTDFALYGRKPTSGKVRCEVRWAGFAGSKRFPSFTVQLIGAEGVWCAFTLIEALFPKGPIGVARPADRRGFLTGNYVSGMRLSRCEDGVTELTRAEVKGSDWLRGTVDAVWNLSTPGSLRELAMKEHVAALTQAHPSEVVVSGDSVVSRTQPLTVYTPVVTETDDGVMVQGVGYHSDLSVVREHWTAFYGLGQWPVEDLYYGLCERFVGKVVLADPLMREQLHGKSVLYLGNHQVMVESLLFSILMGGLFGAPANTIAKMEHQTSWLGKLIEHCWTWPGAKDPKVITFFDRSNPRDLIRIIGQLTEEMKTGGRSVNVHVEGTRSLTARKAVETMAGAFVDMAIKANVPIVPVHFSGAIPVEELEERLDFPVGHGRQDIYLGVPIWPEQLSALGLRERRAFVKDAINATGDWSTEQPNPGDPEFEAAVREWMAKTGASEAHAAMWCTLERLDAPGEAIQRLVDGGQTGSLELGDGPEDAWLRVLAGWVYGPNWQG
ncbi:MAG: 1-acyl-sn-glycerol-3-phosphate acyltransferase [Proteobacteria bacterium]|nr:1-acyl-sn-glycerol-3-phosphate acyltransferase [Pseudomonadota bacterium]